MGKKSNLVYKIKKKNCEKRCGGSSVNGIFFNKLSFFGTYTLGHTKLINCSSDAAHLKIAKVKKNNFFLRPHLHFCTAPTFFLVISAMPLNNSTFSF